MIRLKSEIWAMAHIRRAFSEGAMAVVSRKGNAEAGAIFILTRDHEGHRTLYGPAPAPEWADDGDRFWRLVAGTSQTTSTVVSGGASGGGSGGGYAGDGAGQTIDERLNRELKFDPDIWVLEIEDRDGRHFLDHQILDEDQTPR